MLNPDATAISTAAALLDRFRCAATTRSQLRSAAVRARLRPYQLAGVAWLRSLPEVGGGGVLADEMGVGKTLQAICLLAIRRAIGPHLVVCPTSLVGNWRRELARFTPEVPVLSFSGPGSGNGSPPRSSSVVRRPPSPGSTR